jgi:hypothetical protein
MRSDNPIASAAEDALDRNDAAIRLVDHVLRIDSSEGLVVGVLGPWGSGKTSFVNLTRPAFKERDVVVIDYNPWMFSGADQLVASFFTELSAELKLRPGLGEIGQSVGEYGEALEGFGWLPVIGAWIERGRALTKLFSAATRKNTEGVSARRARLTQALRKIERPIVVVLDDIDRLSTPEVRDVFKLVRLTASFPNIIYLVAFDRTRVESALTDETVSGRDYLEKILQLAVDLPAIREEALRTEALRSLQEASADADWYDAEDEAAWPDVWEEIVRPLLRHMRDVRRYALGVSGTVQLFNGKIALSDIFALEAVRTFMPDLFSYLPSAAGVLTETSSGLGFGREDQKSGQPIIEAVLEKAGPHRQVADALIHRVFPAARQYIGNYGTYPLEWRRVWRQHRRVAHIDNLRFYLEHLEGTNLTTYNLASIAFAAMSDEEEFAAVLDALNPGLRLDVMHALLDFSESYRADHIQSVIPYVLNALPSLPDKKRAIFDIPSAYVVEAIASRLLLTVEDEEQRWAHVDHLWPLVHWHGGRYRLITSLNDKAKSEDGTAPLAPETDLRARWRTEVRTADPDELAAEPDLLRTVRAAQRDDEGNVEWEVPENQALTLALLRASTGTAKSQSLDSRVVSISRTVSWDALVTVFGSDEAVASRVELVRGALHERDAALLSLLDRYVGGWRPEDEDDD